MRLNLLTLLIYIVTLCILCFILCTLLFIYNIFNTILFIRRANKHIHYNFTYFLI